MVSGKWGDGLYFTPAGVGFARITKGGKTWANNTSFSWTKHLDVHALYCKHTTPKVKTVSTLRPRRSDDVFPCFLAWLRHSACVSTRSTGLYPEEYFKTQKADFSANEICLMFLGCTNNLFLSLMHRLHFDPDQAQLFAKSSRKANRNSS